MGRSECCRGRSRHQHGSRDSALHGRQPADAPTTVLAQSNQGANTHTLGEVGSVGWHIVIARRSPDGIGVDPHIRRHRPHTHVVASPLLIGGDDHHDSRWVDIEHRRPTILSTVVACGQIDNLASHPADVAAHSKYLCHQVTPRPRWPDDRHDRPGIPGDVDWLMVLVDADA